MHCGASALSKLLYIVIHKIGREIKKKIGPFFITWLTPRASNFGIIPEK
jgi:hypothetical protein